MASSSPPRRRHSPAVYRRRRFVLLLALTVVVAVVWLLVARPWSGAAEEAGKGTAAPVASATPKQTATALPGPGSETPAPSSTPRVSSSTVPSSTPKPSSSAAAEADVAACTAADLEVEALTDKESYASSQKPKLSISLTNTGDQDCTLNVGTSTQKFTISSGSDVWWRSTDCQTKPSDQVVLLAAGQTVKSASPITWDRTRSSVKTCAATTRTKAPGGGASYHLAVEIGGVAADSTKQFLLR